VGTVVLLDANVLWSAAVRDTLLLAAEHDLFRPAWSLQILEEMARSLKARRPDLDPARIDRTVEQMRRHFPEAVVAGYEDLVPAMRNHEGDRHVLAAAVRAGAAVLLTWNSTHFPRLACEPYGVRVLTPDEFLCDLWGTETAILARVLREQAGHLLNPQRTPIQVVQTLQRTLPRFAALVSASGFR
jgi:predicted nucleic acid-binding protein